MLDMYLPTPKFKMSYESYLQSQQNPRAKPWVLLQLGTIVEMTTSNRNIKGKNSKKNPQLKMICFLLFSMSCLSLLRDYIGYEISKGYIGG
jgi:hypothetical protein